MSQTNVIGVGSTSCVIDRPIECSGTESVGKDKGKGTIAKISRSSNIKEELENAEIIRRIDPMNIFTIGYRGVCVPKMNTKRIIEMLKHNSCSPRVFKKMGKNKLYQLLMDYGGVAVGSISPYLKIKYPSTKKLIPILLTEVLRMLYAVYTLRSLNISHYDIHSSNILLNPDTMRLSLIDFGMMVEDSKIWEQFMSHNFMPRDYSHYPPELLILLWLVKYKPDLLVNVIDGLPESIIRVITVGTQRDNSSELKIVLQQYNNRKYSDLAEFMLPEYFPDDSRSNLYQIRCSGLLGIYMFLSQDSISPLTRQQKLENLLMRSVKTMDSYAVGSVLFKAASYMMLMRPYLSGDPYIQKTISLLESIKDERIDQRVDIQEGMGEMINIFKQSAYNEGGSKNRKRTDTRKEVKIEELVQHLQQLGIY